MTEIVDRVAQAAGITPEQARLAIAAMDPPTEAMTDAYVDATGDSYLFDEGWSAALKAALE